MIWLKRLALGAIAFLVAHALEVYRWRDWFDPEGRHEAWFLNSASAVGATLAVLALTSAIAVAVGSRNAREAGLHALTIAGGAALAMATTLFVIGPGTIFPIVLVFGAGLAVISCVAGGCLGFITASPWRRRNPGTRSS